MVRRDTQAARQLRVDATQVCSIGARLLRGSPPGVQFNQHLAHRCDVVFEHACKMGLEGIVSKRLGSRYRSGRTSDWLKFKNPEAPAVRREAEEDRGKALLS